MQKKTLDERSFSINNVYGNLAVAYKNLGDYEKSLFYHNLSIALQEKFLDSLNIRLIISSRENVGSLETFVRHWWIAKYSYVHIISSSEDSVVWQPYCCSEWFVTDFYLLVDCLQFIVENGDFSIELSC